MCIFTQFKSLLCAVVLLLVFFILVQGTHTPLYNCGINAGLIVRNHSDTLTIVNHIKPVETQMAEYLARASTISEQKQTANICTYYMQILLSLIFFLHSF